MDLLLKLHSDNQIRDLPGYIHLLEQIKEFYNVNKYWPTVKELSDFLNWGERKVHYRLKVLKQTGCIYTKPDCIRNIRLNF